MKLIVFTAEGIVLNEAGIVRSLFEQGLNDLHVRKPDWDAGQLRTYMERIPAEFHSRISLHSHAALLAPEFNLSKIHFTQEQRNGLSPFELELLREKGFILSTSVHSISELHACVPYFRRIFLGPVFNSISKKDYPGKTFPMLGNKGGAEVIGIGGVKNSNISILKELGYDGGAMLGWIWENPGEAVSRFTSVQRKWELQDHTH